MFTLDLCCSDKVIRTSSLTSSGPKPGCRLRARPKLNGMSPHLKEVMKSPHLEEMMKYSPLKEMIEFPHLKEMIESPHLKEMIKYPHLEKIIISPEVNHNKDDQSLSPYLNLERI